MSKEERYAEHTVAWELPNGDSVTKSNYNLAGIETKYIPVQTEVISDDKDKRIADLEAKLEESKKETEKLQDKWEKLKVWANSDGFIHLTPVKQLFIQKMETMEIGEYD